MRVGLLMTSHCTVLTQHFIASEVNTEQVNAATSKRINPGVKLGYSRQSYVEHIKKLSVYCSVRNIPRGLVASSLLK